MGNGSARRFHRPLTGGALIVAVLAALCGPVAAAACRDDTVELKGDWGSARFTVEIADDPDAQARGLMFRTELPLAAGMYFINERPRRTSFWMRNTLIPLDMLFIDASGVVRHIHHNAVPLDETSIPGGDDILTVLEINGGLAARMGIETGTMVRHPAHADWTPVWPC